MPCAGDALKRVQFVPAMIKGNVSYCRMSARIGQLVFSERVMVAPIMFELFKAITANDSHGVASGKFRIVQTSDFPHPNLDDTSTPD